MDSTGKHISFIYSNTGVFYPTESVPNLYGALSGASTGYADLGFDARRVTTIYTTNGNVLTKSLTMNYVIKS